MENTYVLYSDLPCELPTPPCRSITAATDPVAVVGALGTLGAPEKLSDVIKGESLLNDGSAYVRLAERAPVLHDAGAPVNTLLISVHIILEASH